MDDGMPLVAGTYKVIGQIGSGSGGIVYIAEHTRLGKKVVLKADNLAQSTKPEALRREVDALKNLSHACIPQVYDFIEEKGVVYTVVDYIEGESLNKPLKRGERFSQAQVIEWACQLLEALVYLHGRPPHGILHADIKPSNIMRTPQGDVRLIDFNIALALGEEGAVAVGRSFGYASPEHYWPYGASGGSSSGSSRGSSASDAVYGSSGRSSGGGAISGSSGRAPSGDAPSGDAQDAYSSPDTDMGQARLPIPTYGPPAKKTVMLDVRSDIYSLGATLYHLLTGVRPELRAGETKPISPKAASPAVIGIISKAMNPAQDRRWQTAAEMLHAFKNLRERDPRVIRHKRMVALVASILSLLFLAGVFASYTGSRLVRCDDSISALVELSSNALRDGDVPLAVDCALKALTYDCWIFTPPHMAEAQKALTDALDAYSLSDGFKAHAMVELPSAPLGLEISPDGKHAICICASTAAVIDTDAGKVVATLATPAASATASAGSPASTVAKFLGNGTVAYIGEGRIRAYGIAAGRELWVGKPATSIAVSADGRRVAAVHMGDGFATAYDSASGAVVGEIAVAGPGCSLLALNSDGSMLAASFADGSLRAYCLSDGLSDGLGDGLSDSLSESLSDGLGDGGRGMALVDGGSGYTQFEGGFCGRYFAYSASGPDGSAFAMADTVESERIGGFEYAGSLSAHADESGIYVQTGNALVSVDPATGGQTALVDTDEDIICYARSDPYTLITTAGECMVFDGHAILVYRSGDGHGGGLASMAGGMALVADTATAGGLVSPLVSPIVQIIRLVSHHEADLFSYDPSYAHDEARISSDGRTVMLFSYDRFRLYSISDGGVIADVAIPDAGQVYDQQFRRDGGGSRLEVAYNDGSMRAYSAADGSELYEAAGELPDRTLYVEFVTDEFRIESPLHGVPKVYEAKSGRFVRELDKDAYLTYATQVGGYIVTQYITEDGTFFGLLLNGRCETLARLPYLCDIVGGELVFDYPTGNLRKSRIYGADELVAMAEAYGHGG